MSLVKRIERSNLPDEDKRHYTRSVESSTWTHASPGTRQQLTNLIIRAMNTANAPACADAWEQMSAVIDQPD